MTGLRTPVVIGLHPRAGTSTLAAALHASEMSGRERTADIVCVGQHALSLALSPALALATPRALPGPVLAVVAGAVPGPPLPAAGSGFGAVVLIPHVAGWVGARAPSGEIAALLGLSATQLPPPLQAYAAALREVAAALLRSGQLSLGSAPAVVLRPRAAGPVREIVARPAPATATLRTAVPRPALDGIAPGAVSGALLGAVLADLTQPADPPDPADDLDDDALETAALETAAALTAARRAE